MSILWQWVTAITYAVPILSAFIVPIFWSVWTDWEVDLPDGTHLLCESTIASYLESSIVFIPNFASIV